MPTNEISTQQQQQQGQKATNTRLEEFYVKGSAFDEMCDGQVIRPHWVDFLNALNHLSAEDLQKVKQEATLSLRENGVIYSLHDDEKADTNTWELDPIPVIVNNEQWNRLEQGLKQRAKLFDLILKDVYGEQKLLKNGIIPAECVYLHRGFLRPAVNSSTHITLPLIAFDFIHGADGRPIIISDKTQTPVGIGHTLENRLLMSNLLSDEFRLTRTTRIAIYFRAMKEYLQSLSPRAIENPRIAVLTPGPNCKTYFEHAYLASFLGYHLVLGEDLTVQNGIVWLKSLDGLKRVDVILRRIEDQNCDPVTLQPNSLLGVPGLLEAVRQKNVAIANPLGSGLLENPALYPYLPAISQYLLGEELLLPSAATWWCGESSAHAYVMQNIDNLVIKFIDRRRPSVFVHKLNELEKLTLIDEINAMPYLFVGQEILQCSTTPALTNNMLTPAEVQLRMFVTADNTNGFTVMPGGIAHLLNPMHHPDTSSGVNKDIWVTSDPATVATQDVDVRVSSVFNPQRIKELDSVVPSRAAETLFWTGRYVERAECIARQLRLLISEMNNTNTIQGWDNEPYLHLLLDSLQLTSVDNFVEVAPEERPEFSLKKAFNEIRSLMIDPHKSGSLPKVLKDFTQASLGVRDLWSIDTWRTIDDIDEQLKELFNSPISRFSWQKRIDKVISCLMAFIGLVGESMMHENSWRMLEIGRGIERISTQSKLLNYYFSKPRDEITQSFLSEASLRLYETLIAHRRRYRSIPNIEDTLDLLVIDTENPRAIAYQLEELKGHIDLLPKDKKRLRLSDAQAVCLRASTTLKLTDINQMLFSDNSDRSSLNDLLSNLSLEMNTLSEVLAHKYFSHTQPSRQLVGSVNASNKKTENDKRVRDR